MPRVTLTLSEEYRAASLRDLPEGMLQVLADARAQAEEIGNFAEALNARYSRALDHPLNAQIKDMYRTIVTHQLAVAKVAAEIAPAIERLHPDELNRLRNPRPGERMWDVRANAEQA